MKDCDGGTPEPTVGSGDRARKLLKRKTQDAMRGRRSVFEIQKAIIKRGQQNDLPA